jgi:hypothetical protein
VISIQIQRHERSHDQDSPQRQEEKIGTSREEYKMVTNNKHYFRYIENKPGGLDGLRGVWLALLMVITPHN